MSNRGRSGKTVEKILGIVLGIVLVIGGIFVLANPADAYKGIVVWTLITALLITSLVNIFTWDSRRKMGETDGWDLAFSIVALLVALFLIGSVATNYDAADTITIILMAGLIVLGVIRIAMAVMAQRANKALAGLVGGDWKVMLCAGILLVIAGIIGIAKPFAAQSVVGIIIGITIIALGAEMLIGTFARKG